MVAVVGSCDFTPSGRLEGPYNALSGRRGYAQQSAWCGQGLGPGGDGHGVAHWRRLGEGCKSQTSIALSGEELNSKLWGL